MGFLSKFNIFGFVVTCLVSMMGLIGFKELGPELNGKIEYYRAILALYLMFNFLTYIVFTPKMTPQEKNWPPKSRYFSGTMAHGLEIVFRLGFS